MLHVIYGTDTTKKSEALSAHLAPLQAAGVSVSRIGADEFSPGVVRDALGSTSLFGDATCYVLDTPSDDGAYADEVAAVRTELVDAPTDFIVLEEKVLAPERKSYEKVGATLEEHNAQKVQRFNTFALADALTGKDKRTLWVKYQEARAAGIAAEEIIGILWWQLKSIRLTVLCGSAEEAGMKPFPYQKAQRALSKFSTDDINRLSHSLLALYHEGHGGRRDIDVVLERWCLAL